MKKVYVAQLALKIPYKKKFVTTLVVYYLVVILLNSERWHAQRQSPFCIFIWLSLLKITGVNKNV